MVFRLALSNSTAVEKGNRFINIDMTDMDCGIAPEDIDEIFIPFLLHEKRGSVIGLSIYADQVMYFEELYEPIQWNHYGTNN